MSSIILVSNYRINSCKASSVRSIRGTILHGKGRILHINARTIYIAAVGAINQERTAASYIDLGRSSFIQLKPLSLFSISVVSMDFKSRAIGNIDGRTSIHVDRISVASRAAIHGKAHFCTVGNIQSTGQGQHQPRSSPYFRIPLYFHTVERQYTARIVKSEAHPPLAIAR